MSPVNREMHKPYCSLASLHGYSSMMVGAQQMIDHYGFHEFMVPIAFGVLLYDDSWGESNETRSWYLLRDTLIMCRFMEPAIVKAILVGQITPVEILSLL